MFSVCLFFCGIWGWISVPYICTISILLNMLFPRCIPQTSEEEEKKHHIKLFNSSLNDFFLWHWRYFEIESLYLAFESRFHFTTKGNMENSLPYVGSSHTLCFYPKYTFNHHPRLPPHLNLCVVFAIFHLSLLKKRLCVLVTVLLLWREVVTRQILLRKWLVGGWLTASKTESLILMVRIMEACSSWELHPDIQEVKGE